MILNVFKDLPKSNYNPLEYLDNRLMFWVRSGTFIIIKKNLNIMNKFGKL